MSQTGDFDVLKEIPGYKAILKSVIKSQIQLLIEQLSDQTGEESIILTASINDGTLSHLGSNMGKGFFEGHEEIKSQFLGYCQKSQQRGSDRKRQRKQFQRDIDERQQESYQQEPSITKRQKVQQSNARPVSTFDDQISQYLPTPDSENSQTYPDVTRFHAPARQVSASTVTHSTSDSNSKEVLVTDASLVKTEPASEGSSVVSRLRKTADSDQSDLTQLDDTTAAPGVKIEPSCESETELEITGIELAAASSGYQGESGQAVPLEMEYQMFEQGIQSGNQNRHKQREQPAISRSGRNNIRSLLDPTLVSSGESSAFSYGLRGQPKELDSRGQGASLPPQGQKRKIKAQMSRLRPDVVQELRGPLSSGNDDTFNNSHFNCELCGQYYESKRGLNRHMIEHETNCDLVCKKCTKNFKTQKAYEKHMETKHARNHVCPTCGKAFMTDFSVGHHIKNKHRHDVV